MLDPSKLPKMAPSPPEHFQVKDLRGQECMHPLISKFCAFLKLPNFDPRFFSADFPLHPDFIPDPIARRNFRIFVGALIFLCSLVMFLPLGLIFYVLITALSGKFSLDELPYVLVGLYLISLPFFFYFSSKAETAWRRYASYVYKNAEPRTVIATASLRSTAKGIAICLLYPNNYGEVVYARFYNDDYSIIEKLKNERPVCMLRDRNTSPAAVILEIEGDRIWCTSRVESWSN